MSGGSSPRLLVHGHRGARAIYPENTIAGFLYAIDSGVDAVELDVVVTKDDVPVVAHDPHVNPELCAGPYPRIAIRNLRFSQLAECDCGSLKNRRFPNQRAHPGAQIPALAQVLELSALRQIQFDIELKSFPDQPELTPSPEAFVKLVVAEIAGRNLQARVVIQSFDFRVLNAAQRLAPEIRRAALWEGAAHPFLSVAEAAGASIASPHFSLVTADEVRIAHENGLEVVPWTANTAAEWQTLIDAQVDGIITDDPAALIAYLKERSLR